MSKGNYLLELPLEETLLCVTGMFVVIESKSYIELLRGCSCNGKYSNAKQKERSFDVRKHCWLCVFNLNCCHAVGVSNFFNFFFNVRLLSVHLVLVNERCYFYDTIYLSEFQEYRFYIGNIMYVFAFRNQYQ